MNTLCASMLKGPARFAGAVLVALLVLSPLAADAQRSAARQVRIGNSYVIELQGNPSTGYRWRLNASSSENLGIVKVADLGYSSARRGLIGAPAQQRFRITVTGAGFAKLVFDYVQPWEGKPSRVHEHWVHGE